MQPLYKKSIRVFSLLSLVLLAQCCCCFLPLRLQSQNDLRNTQTRILNIVQDDFLAVYRAELYHAVIFKK